MKKIGVISDNHGYMNPKVYGLFAGVDEILHAGDIGNLDIITSLEAIAPVRAVYGNIDTFPIVGRYPEVLAVELGGIRICMLHEFRGLTDPKLEAAFASLPGESADIVICGHSHQAKLEKISGIYIFNPGAAGRKRFSLRPAVGMIHVQENGQFTPEIIYLE